MINIPPRCLKSTLVSVLWPTWEWGPAEKPHLRYLTASHKKELSTRDALASRRVLQSDWYQDLWGDTVVLTGDQNEKTRYENTKRGYRISTSVGAGVVGEGGNRRLVDDPHDMDQIFSDVYRQGGLDWWDNAMTTRLNDPTVDATVLIMQRGHVMDMSGKFLKTGIYEHLCMPMRFDGIRRRTCLGEYDPRTEVGELLFERRFPDQVLKPIESDLGSYGTAGQLQQNPVPLGGNIFNRNLWKYYVVLPEIEEAVISVDCSFKDFTTSDYVAIQVWGRRGAHKFLIYRLKQRLGFAATVQAVRATKAQFPQTIAVLIEDKANGPAVIETLQGEIAGVIPIEPEGGKIARAYAIQPQHEAGNLFLPDPSIAPWVNDYLTELTAFPGAPNDDEADATTQAVNWMSNRYKPFAFGTL